ncbi:MAG: ROK family protein [Flavobacteriales bacterium]|jgi:glucokinase|nr:ROK family protein [Flavobacteriales bacterium]MBK7941471.1 ROK family protein [Flavobacteriales bacterium]MBK9701433.1 ROK family protein [Flavobacteriales bacterium]
MIAGIDIGGTSSKLGLVDGDRIVARTRIPTLGHADPHTFADALAVAVRTLAGEVALTGVGIGAPNGNQHSGTIVQAPNLPWREDVPLAAMLRERLGVPCTLGNDANAAALGEWRYGAGRGIDDLLVVTLGTGLGSGLIVDGRLLLGPFGNAGELGHTIVVIDGRACSCGRKGCLEAYVSIRGIRETFRELGGDAKVLGTEGVLPIAEAARAGLSEALQTFRSTARWLSVGLSNAVAITTPRRIVLFGGIARNGDLLLGPLRERFAHDLLSIYHGQVDLVLSELPEDDAGILGAAALGELRTTSRRGAEGAEDDRQ